ncbi:hypothetical protein [Bradyrhizobium sp. ORS 86]|uniref:hypothetical protein n=1 Tax=Bradyrhizobium sp. ORS 86 TaxID=1685970 RepID=UPI00388F09C5
MQIGVITVDGKQVGVVSWTEGDVVDTFTPNLDGYEPMGRAAESPQGDGASAAPSQGHHGGGDRHSHGGDHRASHGHSGQHQPRKTRFGGEGDTDAPLAAHAPRGEIYHGEGGRPVHAGSAEVDQAIVDASRAHHLDPNFMRAVASIESGMNPASNAHRSTQYKGLYQIGTRGAGNEWERFGNGGNVYSAEQNAMGAARMFDANRNAFRKHFGRDPTDTEMYLMHQQGLGFYTRGAMTNIAGNPYPGMHGPQTHDSFEAGWGRELARRKAGYAARSGGEAKAEPPKNVTFDPETMAP